MKEKQTILVVDDEEAILDIVTQYLHSATDYAVLTARDGFEALAMMDRESIHCCLTDLSMPGMDGLQLTKKIHAFDRTIPVVVMTGFPSTENAIGTLRNGVVDFLTKPIRLDRLAMTLDRVMRERTLFIDNLLLKEEAKKYHQLVKINQELEEKTRQLETMNLILRGIDRAAGSRDLFNILVRLSGKITRCDEAHILILNQGENNPPVNLASFRRDNEKDPIDCSLLQAGIAQKVAADGVPLLVKEDAGCGCMMAVPLKIRSRVFGALVSVFKNGNGVFGEKDLYFSNFLAQKASSSIENLALYENIYENLFSTLYAFVEAIEAKDPYTKQHSSRVTTYALSMAESMGCSQEERDVLNVSGNLHDIGKIGIPDRILLKPGKLTDEEYETIKKHPGIGSNIIGHFHLWSEEKKAIRHHHERWDGRGYPDGLAGEGIPYLSRILSVADVYDALTSDRSYRTKMSEEKAVGIIRENRGTQFDPEIVDVFLKLHRAGKISAHDPGMHLRHAAGPG